MSSINIGQLIGFRYKYHWNDFKQSHTVLAHEIEDRTLMPVREIEKQQNLIRVIGTEIINNAQFDLSAFILTSTAKYRAASQGTGTKYSTTYVEMLQRELEEMKQEKQQLENDIQRLQADNSQLVEQNASLKSLKSHYKRKYIELWSRVKEKMSL